VNSHYQLLIGTVLEYLFGELIANLLASLFPSRRGRHATPRDQVLHAVRLSRRGRLSAESHEYAQRWLITGSRHIDLFRLRRYQGRVLAELDRVQSSPVRGA
jgi:hypothetical protein